MSKDINLLPSGLLALLPIIPDFPIKGVMFRDISPLLADAKAFSQCIDQLAVLTKDMSFDYIIGAEARGFVFGAALALRLEKGLILARKPGKLPVKTISESYGLEYGKDALEIEEGLIPHGARVLLIDDVIATGGTLKATANLITRAGGEVAGIACVLSIDFLKGEELLKNQGYKVKSLLNI